MRMASHERNDDLTYQIPSAEYYNGLGITYYYVVIFLTLTLAIHFQLSCERIVLSHLRFFYFAASQYYQCQIFNGA